MVVRFQVQARKSEFSCWGWGCFVYVHIPERGLWWLSKEQGLVVLFWAKWDPVGAKWDPCGQFVRKVGKSALESGKTKSIIICPTTVLDASQLGRYAALPPLFAKALLCVLCIYWIQAPNMMHTIIAFVESMLSREFLIVPLALNHFKNRLGIASQKPSDMTTENDKD